MRPLKLFNYPATRVILFSQFDRRIGQRTAAPVRLSEMGGHLFQPGVELRERIAWMRARVAVPARPEF